MEVGMSSLNNENETILSPTVKLIATSSMPTRTPHPVLEQCLSRWTRLLFVRQRLKMASLAFATYPRLSLNSQQSYLSLLSAGTMGTHYHVCLEYTLYDVFTLPQNVRNESNSLQFYDPQGKRMNELLSGFVLWRRHRCTALGKIALVQESIHQHG